MFSQACVCSQGVGHQVNNFEQVSSDWYQMSATGWVGYPTWLGEELVHPMMHVMMSYTLPPLWSGGIPPASDTWWSTSKTCSNLFTWYPTPNHYWHLVVSTEARTVGKWAVHILLECFLVFSERTFSWSISLNVDESFKYVCLGVFVDWIKSGLCYWTLFK